MTECEAECIYCSAPGKRRRPGNNVLCDECYGAEADDAYEAKRERKRYEPPRFNLDCGRAQAARERRQFGSSGSSECSIDTNSNEERKADDD